MKNNKNILQSVIFSVLVLTLTSACAAKKRDAVKPAAADATGAGAGNGGGDDTANSKTLMDDVDPNSKSNSAQVDAQVIKPKEDAVAPVKPKLSEQKATVPPQDKPVTEETVPPINKDLKIFQKKKPSNNTSSNLIKTDDTPKPTTGPTAATAADVQACKDSLNTPEKIAERKKIILERVATIEKEAAAVEEAKEQEEQKQALAEQKESEKTTALRKTEKAKADPRKVTKASDSDEIKKTAQVYLSFKNLTNLTILSDTNDAVYKNQVTDEKAAIALLAKGNESQMCRVEGAYAFHPEDALELIPNSYKLLVDKEADVYESRLDFKNKNGILTFDCHFASRGFSLEEFATNFASYLELHLKGQVVSGAGFVNPILLQRMVDVIQIQDLEAIKKVIKGSGHDEFAFGGGKVLPVDQLYASVAAKKDALACVVNNVMGELNSNQAYIRVEKGLLQDTPESDPTATVYYVYRADEKNAFSLECKILKTMQLKDLLAAGKNIIKFGALDRIEFKKQYTKVIEINENLKKEKQDDSMFLATDAMCVAMPAAAK